MNKSQAMKLKLLLVVWLISMIIGLMYYSLSRLVAFDPEYRLLDNAVSVDFSNHLTKALLKQYGSVSGKAFHFYDNGCFCNRLAQQHISEVKSQVKGRGFENNSININEFEQFNHFIPSTPAVVLFNNRGDLIFLGPYSTGYLCTAGNGFVEQLIDRMQQDAVDKSIIISVAKGCYCNNNLINSST